MILLCVPHSTRTPITRSNRITSKELSRSRKREPQCFTMASSKTRIHNG